MFLLLMTLCLIWSHWWPSPSPVWLWFSLLIPPVQKFKWFLLLLHKTSAALPPKTSLFSTILIVLHYAMMVGLFMYFLIADSIFVCSIHDSFVDAGASNLPNGQGCPFPPNAVKSWHFQSALATKKNKLKCSCGFPIYPHSKGPLCWTKKIQFFGRPKEVLLVMLHMAVWYFIFYFDDKKNTSMLKFWISDSQYFYCIIVKPGVLRQVKRG